MHTELIQSLKNTPLEDLKSIPKLNEDQRAACSELTPDQQWVGSLSLSSAADGNFAAAANQFYNASEQKRLNPSMKDFFVLYELKDFSEFCNLALKSITSVRNPDAEPSVEELLAALASPKEETRNETSQADS